MSSHSGTFILTGASGGIGLAIAQEYSRASYPFTGIYTVRDAASSTATSLQPLISKSSHPQTVESLNLSSLLAVRAFATSVLSRVESRSIPAIRALLLNAGTQDTTGLKFTADEAKQRKLWDGSLGLVGMKESDLPV
jgi:NAD(P)-dependent dehydrogenase (short-subunit alcohol dehydrogenase family)